MQIYIKFMKTHHFATSFYVLEVIDIYFIYIEETPKNRKLLHISSKFCVQ